MYLVSKPFEYFKWRS